jgi:hypothetical protein
MKKLAAVFVALAGLVAGGSMANAGQVLAECPAKGTYVIWIIRETSLGKVYCVSRKGEFNKKKLLPVADNERLVVLCEGQDVKPLKLEP